MKIPSLSPLWVGDGDLAANWGEGNLCLYVPAGPSFSFADVLSADEMMTIRRGMRAADRDQLSASSVLFIGALMSGPEVLAALPEGVSLRGLLWEVGGVDLRDPAIRGEFDWKRRQLVVFASAPGMVIGRQGWRIRPVQALLKGIGWTIDVRPTDEFA